MNQPDKSWKDPGFPQTDDHPVVCVNWDDARAYAKWLSSETRKLYRLLSESEWEYAARARTTTARYWGENFDPEGCKFANVGDASIERLERKGLGNAKCDDGNVYTARADAYTENSFKLHNMIGNAWEWTEDCWNDSYKGAPNNGEAMLQGDCGRRVVRGGGWGSYPDVARAADRDGVSSDYRHDVLGFRLTRTD